MGQNSQGGYETCCGKHSSIDVTEQQDNYCYGRVPIVCNGRTLVPAYAGLDPDVRLDHIDFLATTILTLAFEIAGAGDARVVRPVLHGRCGNTGSTMSVPLDLNLSSPNCRATALRVPRFHGACALRRCSACYLGED